MPRRKKNGQSPARPHGGPPEGGRNLDYNAAFPLQQGHGGAMDHNFPPTDSPSASTKEQITESMQEMFSHLDPEVIYIVLSECDFKVENAMDSLLQLSEAAEFVPQIPSTISGFERTAADLLCTSPIPVPRPDPDPDSPEPSEQLLLSPPTCSLLTEELDVQVDLELESINSRSTMKEEHSSRQYFSAGESLSSVPPSSFTQHPVPELLQSSLKPKSRGPSSEQPSIGGGFVQSASSSLNQLSTDGSTEKQQPVVDFTHLLTEESADKPNLLSGRPSAFQAYNKQDPLHGLSERAGFMPSDGIVGGARSKVNMMNQTLLAYPPWSAFPPHMHGNRGPTFITPVAQTPSNWPHQTKLASPWMTHSPFSQAPLKPSPTIPKSWAVPAAPQLSQLPGRSRLRLEGNVLVMLRGAPGSGKSTVARALLEHNSGGIVLSTDDYFFRNGHYHYDPAALGEAHEWNHKRAKEAFERGTNPIIIDNTNMQGWEMRPYVAQALKHGYKVLFREPDTWWKNKPRELERRTTHTVPLEKIRRMLNGYERFVTVQSIMGSHMPESKHRLLQENKSFQLKTSLTPCPDLVGEPGLMEGIKKSLSQLSSSLPDVSSISQSNEVGKLEDDAFRSTESLNIQPTTRPMENADTSGDFSLGDLDSELDAELELQLQQNRSAGDQRIPDCIVESVMSEDSRGEEIPVAFSSSIAQREKRERLSTRCGFDRTQPADLVKDTNQSEKHGKEKENKEEADGVQHVWGEEVKEVPKMLDFEGDWPSEGSLDQRQIRRERLRGRHSSNGNEVVSHEANENVTKLQPRPDVTEVQKDLDLSQTGVGDIQACASHSSPLSLRCEVEAGVRAKDVAEGEERSVNNSTGELPDCVLDWTTADSCRERKSRIDKLEETTTEKEASNVTADNSKVILNTTSHPLSTIMAVSELAFTEAEISKCHDAVESHNNQTEAVKESVDVDTNSCTKAGATIGIMSHSSHIGDVHLSPMCEGSVEAESSPVSAGSQERKQRQGRRSGKQCKLALTFTQNCPSASVNTNESLSATSRSTDSSLSSFNTDVKVPSPDRTTSLNPEFDLFTESEPATREQPVSPPPLPPSPPCLLADTSYFTQTEPQDFALLWRLNHQHLPDDQILAANCHSSEFSIIYGDTNRFVPALSSTVFAAVAVQPFGHNEVLYRVVHEKGTQVEEKDLGGIQDRLESLCILSRHFKLVSFDTLEDLYDKCHEHLEWTTNLLLDSGERFFKDDDDEQEKEERGNEDDKDGVRDEYDENLLVPLEVVQTSMRPDENGQARCVDETELLSATVGEPNQTSTKADFTGPEGVAAPVLHPDTTTCPEKTQMPDLQKSTRGKDGTDRDVISEPEAEEDGAWGRGLDDGVITEESRTEIEDKMASMDEIDRVLQEELEALITQEKLRQEEEKRRRSTKDERRSSHLDIQSVELKLPTEVAIQLTELFGPVGVEPGSCATEDYEVQMDLHLAKLLHQKWKETIQERQRQATLSFHLFKESSDHWGESEVDKRGSQERMESARFLLSADGYPTLDSETQACGQLPAMDHWRVSRPHVSLRDIIKEEQILQKNVEKTRQSRADLDRRDGAVLLRESKLFTLFPGIDRHFLQDIFRDHNYNLAHTELFLRSLLEEEPVKTVVAPEAPRSDHHRAASKEREKKPPECIIPDYQDVEDPEYDDFRAEASLQRRRQLESFAKAAEAYKQGRKEVASFYAQQGHLHGQRMREANHRAAVQIFERVNSSLMPRNILDLHGLHVDEALQHLAQVLLDKASECEKGLCRPQLSVITGRGNHSQGGVARIRPAVIDYLTNKHYRFTEPKPGLVLVCLK